MSRQKLGEKRTALVVYLDETAKERLAKVAESHHKPMSQFVRETLESVAPATEEV